MAAREEAVGAAAVQAVGEVPAKGARLAERVLEALVLSHPTRLHLRTRAQRPSELRRELVHAALRQGRKGR